MNKMLVDLQEFVNEVEKIYGDRDAYRYIVGDVVINKTFKQLKADSCAIASWLVKKEWQLVHCTADNCWLVPRR